MEVAKAVVVKAVTAMEEAEMVEVEMDATELSRAMVWYAADKPIAIESCPCVVSPACLSNCY